MSRPSYSTPYLFLAGASAIAVVAIFLVFWPSLQRIRGSAQEAEEIMAETAEKQLELASLQNKFSSLEMNRNLEKELDSLLPNEENIEDILRLLERSASSAGIKIDKLSDASGSAQSRLRSERARGGLAALPASVVPVEIQLQAAGTYLQLRTFLEEVGKSIRLAEVRDIKLDREEKNPDSIRANLTVTYYQSQLALD